MFAVENYIKQCDESQATIFGYLRQMILSFSTEIEEEITNNTPTYKLGDKVCKVSKETKGTTLSFLNNREVSQKAIHFDSPKEMDIDTVFSAIAKAFYN